jgi:Uma2 family endonuclease
VKKNLYERHGVRELWLVDDGSSSVLTLVTTGSQRRSGAVITYPR